MPVMSPCLVGLSVVAVAVMSSSLAADADAPPTIKPPEESPVQPLVIQGPSTDIVPLDINDFGEVVGEYAYLPLIRHGFFWSTARGFVDLGAAEEGGQSHATGINNCGEIVGWTTDAEGTFASLQAALWNSALEIEDISSSIGPMVLRDINDAGNLVGLINSRSYFWSVRTGLVDLGGIGGTYSEPFELNNRDEVAGTAYTEEFIGHTFRWTMATGMEDLHPSGSQWSEGASINDHGDVAGWYYPPTGGVHAVLFRHNGDVVDLNPMGPTDTDYPSFAVGVNRNGYIVGDQFFPNGASGDRALIISKRRRSQLLSMDNPNVTATRAIGINRLGQVIGTVSLNDNTSLGVVWQVGKRSNSSSEADSDESVDPIVKRPSLCRRE